MAYEFVWTDNGEEKRQVFEGDIPRVRLCHVHKEETPSLVTHGNHFYCFGCGVRGTASVIQEEKTVKIVVRGFAAEKMKEEWANIIDALRSEAKRPLLASLFDSAVLVEDNKDSDHERCSDCRFFDTENVADGWCRINPPTIQPEEEYDPVGCWPKVFADDWCGDHKPKKEEGFPGRRIY